jgi:hypothetical protein
MTIEWGKKKKKKSGALEILGHRGVASGPCQDLTMAIEAIDFKAQQLDHFID